MNRLALIALMIAFATSASADGIWNTTKQFVGNMSGASNDGTGGGGISNGGPTGGGTVTPCSQTGMIFTNSCNAILYVVVLM